MRNKNKYDAGDIIAVVVITILFMAIMNSAITNLLGA